MNDSYYRKKKPGKQLLQKTLSRYLKKGVTWKLLVLAALVGYIMFGSRGVVQRLNLEFEKQQMIENVHQANAETEKLEEQLRRVSEDDSFIEEIARERYGMIREGDSVYRIAEE
jgi:cell division protein FtsB